MEENERSHSSFVGDSNSRFLMRRGKERTGEKKEKDEKYGRKQMRKAKYTYWLPIFFEFGH